MGTSKMPLPGPVRKVVNIVAIKDEEDGRQVDKWTSPDILPVLPRNRTFTSSSYASYWVSGGVCASFWAMGGTAISDGLSPGLAMAALVLASLVCAIVAYYCSKPGTKYHLGFPMMSRVTFGMYGSYFVVVLKCFTTFLYTGIQSYWGGQACHVMLAAIFPTYHNMKNTLPASANLTTADLIGTLVYWVVFVGILTIPPYKLTKFFLVSFCACIATILGMFVWAMAANKGPGDLVTPTKALSAGDTALVFIQVMGLLCGSFTGSSVRHSDWSRYAATPRAPLIGIWIAGPLGVSATAIFGVLVTSAASDLYGEIIWQPITLLLHIQQTDYSSGARAATFFAGLGWFMSQIAVNVSLNAVSAGMDLTSLAPQILNARRGSMVLAVIGLVVCPWNFVNSASTFTSVLSAFGLFISPLIGMYISDFWIIRKGNWKVPDLYIGNTSSAYWYTGGFNIRGFVVWFGTIWLSLPGFVHAISGVSVGVAWQRIFQITFFVGLSCGFVLYTIIALVFPPPFRTTHEDLDMSFAGSDEVIDGKDVETGEKQAVDREKVKEMADM